MVFALEFHFKTANNHGDGRGWTSVVVVVTNLQVLSVEETSFYTP